MCIILDACCASDLLKADYLQSRILIEWVRQGGRVALGGPLRKELFKTPVGPLLTQWNAAGRLVNIAEAVISPKIKGLRAVPKKSNDDHVIALAQITGASVIATKDQALMADLKDKALMGSRRKIYPMPDAPIKDARINRAVLRNSNCAG